MPAFRRPRPHRAPGAALPLLVALLLTACSTPRAPYSTGPAGSHEPASRLSTAGMLAAQDALTRMAAQQERLYRVAAPLLINNADLCKKHARGLLGFTAKNKYSYPGEFTDAAQAALGYDERLQVSGVLAGSEFKTRLAAEVDLAMARGVFGSPFIFVDGEAFWGVDRLPQVERWLAEGGF